MIPTLPVSTDPDLAACVGSLAGNASFVALLVGYENPQTISATSIPKVINISFVV
jgi:hypothetical protein